MKWKKKTVSPPPPEPRPSYPRKGDIRVVKHFLLTPHTVGDEVRWLCWVKILQTYEVTSGRSYDCHGNRPIYRKWVDTSWVDDNTEVTK